MTNLPSAHYRKKARSESEAKALLQQLQAQPGNTNLKAYHCKCGQWHLGHQNTPEEAKQALIDLEKP